MQYKLDFDSSSGPRDGTDAHGPGLTDYLAIARRRWWLILACAVLGVAGMWLAEMGHVDEYTARVLLQKKEQASPLDALNAENGAPPPPDMASQVEILRSRSLLAAVVDSVRLQVAVPPPDRRETLFSAIELRPGWPAGSFQVAAADSGLALLASDGARLASAAPGEWLEGPGFRLQVAQNLHVSAPVPVVIQDREGTIGALRGALSIEQPMNTNLLRVSYRNPDPLLAAEVANTVAQVYEEQSDARAREAATRRREFLADQLAAQADSLAGAQSALASYQQRARILDPKSEGQTLASGLFQAESDARTLRFQESVLQSVLKSLQGTATNDQGLRRMVALSNELVPNGPDLYKRLQELQTERAGLTASRYGYTSRGPRVEVVDSMIRETKNEMRSVVQQSLAMVADRRQDAEARVKELQAQVGALPGRATAFDRLAQSADNVQKTFDLLAGKYYEAQVAEATASGDVALLDRAAVPTTPDPSRRRRDLVLALIMGLLAGFAVAVVWERLDTTIRHRGDAERASALQVLGMVPKVDESAMRNGTDPAAEPQAQGEMDPYRALRTRLRFVRAEPPKLLAVTSPGPGEGKTFTAAHLALALTQSGSRVLLVDCDLRRPTVHARHGVPRAPGLTDVLVGLATMKDSVHKLESGVYVLAAGTSAPDPAELLDTPAFQKLLALCRERFDTVVLDTPPVLAVPESALVCRASEGTMVVAQPYQTRAPALSEAVRQLRQVKTPLLGLVLNRVPAGSSGYGGYYYYYYRYGEYYGDGTRRKHSRSRSHIPAGSARHDGSALQDEELGDAAGGKPPRTAPKERRKS